MRYINVDGAMFGALQSTVVGDRVVIWDSVGYVTTTVSKWLPYLLGPSESEAMSIEEGVNFAWDVGVRELVFECDSNII